MLVLPERSILLEHFGMNRVDKNHSAKDDRIHVEAPHDDPRG
jgi:hypothetical protein